MILALNSRTPSSNILCATPIVSTYFGPSSSYTVGTERQLSVRTQLISQRLTAAFCAFAKPWSKCGKHKQPIDGIYESKRRFSVNLTRKNSKKNILMRAESNNARREVWIQMDISKSAQVYPNAQRALQRFQEKKNKSLSSLNGIYNKNQV